MEVEVKSAVAGSSHFQLTSLRHHSRPSPHPSVLGSLFTSPDLHTVRLTQRPPSPTYSSEARPAPLSYVYRLNTMYTQPACAVQAPRPAMPSGSKCLWCTTLPPPLPGPDLVPSTTRLGDTYNPPVLGGLLVHPALAKPNQRPLLALRPLHNTPQQH